MASAPILPTICVGTPCYGGLVTTGYMTSIIRLMQYAGDHQFNLNIDLLPGDSLITRSRNTLLARFLTRQEATHLMFIDADIAFEPELVGGMLAFDEDVVGGMYPAKTLCWSPPAAIRDSEPPAAAALQYVGRLNDGPDSARRGRFASAIYCGTGFMLIKRRVIERMIEAYPSTAYQSHHFHWAGLESQRSYALFDCIIDPDSKEYLSEDFGFCHRWRAIGGKIWLDIEGVLAHTGAYQFVGQPGLRFAGPAAGVNAPAPDLVE
jgi:hypothetical protein